MFWKGNAITVKEKRFSPVDFDVISGIEILNTEILRNKVLLRSNML